MCQSYHLLAQEGCEIHFEMHEGQTTVVLHDLKFGLVNSQLAEVKGVNIESGIMSLCATNERYLQSTIK